MNEAKSTNDPSDDSTPDTFEQHYAGTFVGKRMHSRQHAEDPPYQPHDSKRESNPIEATMRIWDFITEPKHSNAIMAIFTVLIFASGLAYTVFAGLQWKVTNQSMHLDNRAWVGPVEIVNPQFVVGGKPSYWKEGDKTTLGVFITNSGRSPARNMHSRTNMKAMKADEMFVADYPPSPVSKPTDSISVLQPGMRLELDSLPSGVALTKEHIDGFTEGTWNLYFYGDVQYDDIFNEPHETRFCLLVSRDATRLQTCKTYNDAN